MLPTVIFVIEAIRRAIEKTGRGLSMIADVLHEAMDHRRDAHRKFPFSE